MNPLTLIILATYGRHADTGTDGRFLQLASNLPNSVLACLLGLHPLQCSMGYITRV